jgi:hypothetical protein
MVLAESGFGENDLNANHVAVHESLQNLASANDAYGPDGLPILQPKPSDKNAVDPARENKPGPATLRTIRLSSADPPLSVIFDLSGPVAYDDNLDNGKGSSSLTIYLKSVTPDANLSRHMTFDRSIFRDCDVESEPSGTKVTVNTTPVSRFAITPVSNPDRLLVTFTPENGTPVVGDQAFGTVGPQANTPD